MTATTGGDGPRERRWHATRMWLGHYESTVSGSALAAMMVLGLAGSLYPSHSAGDWVFVALMAIPAALYAATAGCEIYHDRRLCLRHLNDAPLLDPQGEVARAMTALKAWHHKIEHPARPTAIGSALLVAFVFAPIILPHQLLLLRWVPALGIAVFLWRLSRCNDTHRRLEPWCPMCRRGRGDDGPPVFPVEPMPDRGRKPTPAN